MKDKKEKKQFIKGIIAGVLLSTLVVVGFKFATGDIFGKNIDKATAIKLQNIDCLIEEKAEEAKTEEPAEEKNED